MELEFKGFAFVIALAAVVNGLGMVRILTSLAEYVRHHAKVDVIAYWVFNLWVAFQFLLHLLLWWTMWGLQAVSSFTFLHLLFVLLAPILLYFGSSLLIPNLDANTQSSTCETGGAHISPYTKENFSVN